MISGSNQVVICGDGSDVLDASVGRGNNFASGGGGNDELFAGRNDRLLGDAGNDTLEGATGAGDNELRGGSENDELTAHIRDRLFGDAGNDILDASAGMGSNRLEGGDDADILFAGRDDELFGDAGRDELFAGLGSNTLTGGADSDRFRLVNGSELPDAVNTVSDFNPAEDILAFSRNGVDTLADIGLVAQGEDTLVRVDGTAVALLIDVAPNAVNANNTAFEAP